MTRPRFLPFLHERNSDLSGILGTTGRYMRTRIIHFVHQIRYRVHTCTDAPPDAVHSSPFGRKEVGQMGRIRLQVGHSGLRFK